MQVQSPGEDGPLEEEMAPHSSFLAGKIPWTAEPGVLQSTRCQESDMNRYKHERNIKSRAVVPLPDPCQVQVISGYMVCREFKSNDKNQLKVSVLYHLHVLAFLNYNSDETHFLEKNLLLAILFRKIAEVIVDFTYENISVTFK